MRLNIQTTENHWYTRYPYKGMNIHVELPKDEFTVESSLTEMKCLIIREMNKIDARQAKWNGAEV